MARSQPGPGDFSAKRSFHVSDRRGCDGGKQTVGHYFERPCECLRLELYPVIELNRSFSYEFAVVSDTRSSQSELLIVVIIVVGHNARSFHSGVCFSIHS